MSWLEAALSAGPSIANVRGLKPSRSPENMPRDRDRVSAGSPPNALLRARHARPIRRRRNGHRREGRAPEVRRRLAEPTARTSNEGLRFLSGAPALKRGGSGDPLRSQSYHRRCLAGCLAQLPFPRAVPSCQLIHADGKAPEEAPRIDPVQAARRHRTSARTPQTCEGLGKPNTKSWTRLAKSRRPAGAGGRWESASRCRRQPHSRRQNRRGDALGTRETTRFSLHR